MLFSHLLPPARVTAMMDSYIAQSEAKLAQILAGDPKSPGEILVQGLGRAIYEASLKYLRDHRADVETNTAQAAE
jgi:hypothetical protein